MGKQKKEKEKDPAWVNLERGIELVQNYWLFQDAPPIDVSICGEKELGKRASVLRGGIVYANRGKMLSPEEWAYILALQLLHEVFNHDEFYARMAETGEAFAQTFQPYLWDLACRMYNAKFLENLRFGMALTPMPAYMEEVEEEEDLYALLASRELTEEERRIAAVFDEFVFCRLSSEGLHILGRKEMGEQEWESLKHRGEDFSQWLSWEAARAVTGEDLQTLQHGKAALQEAREWFVSHYPLLGSLAAGFQVSEDYQICREQEIQIAAVDVTGGVIYINPAASLTRGELRFVLAHEFLHAGLLHHQRRRGRDPVLWNIACDFVINGWLREMDVGDMPQGVLYEEEFANLSAESIYDILAGDLRRSLKYQTFRGYGKGDIWEEGPAREGDSDGQNLDEFYREALAQGLEYHQRAGRGLLPAGLTEDILALGMPPVPWDVKLAEWFQIHFPSPEPKRGYARASRRQSVTPDIPRPGKVDRPENNNRTFGVVLDTSGSMRPELLGKALGAIASYAEAKEVHFVRVVFCDARAYDAGYLTPEEIAGRVEVTGRGGTVLQPGIDFLEKAEDFPKDGPLLIITDGLIEKNLSIHRDHAFLIPQRSRLPFRAGGQVFYLE